MNPKTVRMALRSYLERNLRIDEWGLNFPRNTEDPNVPPSIAREEPTTNDISTKGSFPGLGGETPVIGTMRLSFTIMFRFDAVYEYEDLPKKDAETLLMGMIARLRIQPECLGADFREIEASGSIIVVETENNDWLLVYKISVSPSFEVEIEDFTVTSTLMTPFDPAASVFVDEEDLFYAPPLVSGNNLAALRVVALINDLLVYADSSNIAHAYAVVGLVLEPIAAGMEAQALQEGIVSDSSWNWIAGQPIYLGAQGQLTQTAPEPPLVAFLLPVGAALLSDRIQFNVGVTQIYGN